MADTESSAEEHGAEAGQIHLSIIHQGDSWTDQHGQKHDLDDMEDSYLRNVLAYLDRNAQRFIEMEERADWEKSLHSGGWDSDFDGPIPFDAGRWISPQAWMRASELVCAIESRLRERKTQADMEKVWPALAALAATGLVTIPNTVSEDPDLPGYQFVDGESAASNDDPGFWEDEAKQTFELFIRAAQHHLTSSAIRNYFRSKPGTAV